MPFATQPIFFLLFPCRLFIESKISFFIIFSPRNYSLFLSEPQNLPPVSVFTSFYFNQLWFPLKAFLTTAVFPARQTLTAHTHTSWQREICKPENPRILVPGGLPAFPFSELALNLQIQVFFSFLPTWRK